MRYCGDTTRCWYTEFGRYLSNLGNHLSHAFGKRMMIYITNLVYEIRDITHGDGKWPVGFWER